MRRMMERMDRLMDGLSEEEKRLFSENRFPYILSKADLYLRIGPEKYRSKDFFGMPDVEWNKDELEIIADGCRQIQQGREFTPEKPFTGLDVMGFSQLFSLFHFENTGRETTRPGPGKFLDKMEMSHLMEGGKVTYYNLVEYDISKSYDSKEI
jgi:hypothetical protein